MGATIESGFDYPDSPTTEESYWSPLYFILSVFCGLMIIVPVLYLALTDNPTTTDKWFAVATVTAFLVLGGLICGTGIKEVVKETKRESAK